MKELIQTDTQHLQQIRKLTHIIRILTYASSIDEVLQLTADHAADLLAANKSLLMIVNDEGMLTIRASYGVDSALAQGFCEPMNEAIVSRVAGLVGARPESFLGVPLVVAGVIKGMLAIIRPPDSDGAEQDEMFLSALADQAATALEKSQLDELGEFREQLIGIIGHDLRNPLSSVLMAARLLLEREGVGERETELARRISRSASLAVRLIDQLLDLTRSRLGGGIPILPTYFDLNEVVRQLVGECELTHLDRPLRVEAHGNLTGTWDRDRTYQLLANVIGNAMQHGEPRTPVEVRIAGEETEVVIDVYNQGAPISAETLPFIFDAFRQGRDGGSYRAPGVGLGLGLFIAQQIAQAHKGGISVTSSAADGTTFRVRLPRGDLT